jgi:multidrug efflux system membrane fusion protein
VIVPSRAVQVSQTGNFVFVIDANNKAKVQKITTERQVGTDTVITSGLNGGETVVTDGQLLLADGKSVSTRPASAAGEGKPRAGS